MGLYFSSGGRLAFCGDRPVLTEADCTGCRCCGSDNGDPDPWLGFGSTHGSQCTFNRNAKIRNYQYYYYIGSFLSHSFLAAKDFDKFPAFTTEGGASCGGRGGSCSFCQQYWFRRYDLDGNIVDGPRLISGGGEALGFVYTSSGWWDGNEASLQTNNNPPSSVVMPVPSGSSGRSGTRFACGVCSGFIHMRYYYGDVIGAFADVSFEVYNPDCNDEYEPGGVNFSGGGWSPPPEGYEQLPYE